MADEDPLAGEVEYPGRNDDIAALLAAGQSPTEVGRRYGLTPGQVQQIDREQRAAAAAAALAPRRPASPVGYDAMAAADRYGGEDAVVHVPFGWVAPARIRDLAARPNPDEVLSEEAMRLVAAGRNANTDRTYRLQWKKFVQWCGDTGRQHMPATPVTCIEWMNELWRRRGRYGRPTAPESVALSLKVIAVAHQRAPRNEVDEAGRQLYGWVPPTTHHLVRKALRGYTQQWLAAGHRPDTAYPLTPGELEMMVGTLDTRSGLGLCDAVLLSIGYDLGGRRVELCDINIGDVELHVREPGDVTSDDYMVVTIPKSKTDQRGEGAEVVLYAHPARTASTCPVRYTLRWFAALEELGYGGPREPLLRVVLTGGPQPTDGSARKCTITDRRIDGHRVEVVVKRAAATAGLLGGPGKRLHIVPHSLRAGSATSAAEHGADTAELDAHYRWSVRGNTSKRYVRAGRSRALNPTRRIWADDDPDT